LLLGAQRNPNDTYLYLRILMLFSHSLEKTLAFPKAFLCGWSPSLSAMYKIVLGFTLGSTLGRKWRKGKGGNLRNCIAIALPTNVNLTYLARGRQFDSA